MFYSPGLFLVYHKDFAPIPRPALAERSSRREGGDFRIFYARGFAPCIPGAKAGAALARPAQAAACGMSRGDACYGQETGHPAGGLGVLLAGFIFGVS